MGLKEVRQCEVCGKSFHPRNSKPGHGRFCSKPCKGVWMRGENNPSKPVHGMTGTPTYKSWDAMRRRCGTPTDKDFPRYGGRGIRVCERWQNSFQAFVADMGIRPPQTTLDRVDVNGNYEPGNCRWATVVQQNNNRRSNKSIRYDGRSQTVAQWAREAGLSPEALSHRLKNGWPISDALSIPIDHSNRRP